MMLTKLYGNRKREQQNTSWMNSIIQREAVTDIYFLLDCEVKVTKEKLDGSKEIQINSNFSAHIVALQYMEAINDQLY